MEQFFVGSAVFSAGKPISSFPAMEKGSGLVVSIEQTRSARMNPLGLLKLNINLAQNLLKPMTGDAEIRFWSAFSFYLHYLALCIKLPSLFCCLISSVSVSPPLAYD
jgi:hypothetical protein